MTFRRNGVHSDILKKSSPLVHDSHEFVNSTPRPRTESRTRNTRIASFYRASQGPNFPSSIPPCFHLQGSILLLYTHQAIIIRFTGCGYRHSPSRMDVLASKSGSVNEINEIMLTQSVPTDCSGYMPFFPSFFKSSYRDPTLSGY